MIFPKGFTGFSDPKDRPIGVLDIGEFKSVCFQVARELRGKLTEFEIANVTPSFHCATLEWQSELTRISILCNCHSCVVGLCKPRQPGCCSHEYVDAPAIADA